MLDRRTRGRALRFLSWIGVLAALLCVATPASAYPWMIRHTYQGCVPCHSDPSGAGLLTEYGRAMGENVLRMRYGSKAPDEAPAYSRFAFGVPTPEWLLLGGSVRNAIWYASDQTFPSPTDATKQVHYKLLQMEADLRAEIHVSRFRASGSLGYNHDLNLAETALITHRDQDNLVSREHWLGVDLGEDNQFLLRAGRMNIPFGIRNNEHEMFVRSQQVTRTNINQSQQLGLSLYYSGKIVRGELMAILGNYQLDPDSVRERGYAGYAEFLVADSTAFGISSMVTYARYDYAALSPHTIRQAHGVFTRWAPKEPVVILAEADALINTSDAQKDASGNTVSGGTSAGVAGMVQVDVEPTQGLHLIGTGEWWVQNNMPIGPTPGLARSFSGWASALWFFAPHCDFRFDFVASSVMNQKVGYYLLPQIHVYL